VEREKALCNHQIRKYIYIRVSNVLAREGKVARIKKGMDGGKRTFISPSNLEGSCLIRTGQRAIPVAFVTQKRGGGGGGGYLNRSAESQ